ncbi:hypothetical protein LSAT2_025012 [Lamellibrachia satsuma]|nr:hypothetical protein LSAT2_025012 [Lamellibrachia satsuma]
MTTTSDILVTTTVSPNTTVTSACHWILTSEIGYSRVRIWDLIILVPNVLFLAFLVLCLRLALAKLRRTNSPIFSAFYALVFVVAVISVLRCVVSMTVNAAVPIGDITDKVLWLVLRFFLLATELSVVVFGLAFGHLDSKTSIRWVVVVTFSVALIYSSTQAVLEFMYPDDRFHVSNTDREYDIFGHGGMLFLFISSIFFFVIYLVICILPFTRLKQHFALPSKMSFYWYCFFLALLNVAQATGSALLHYHIQYGMCVVDVTAYIYFTCFAALVYRAFLCDFFRITRPQNILFSYKAHVDDDDDDTVSLPHQSYNASPKTDDTDDFYDSTQIDEEGPNPLYHADVHLTFSPDLNIDTDYYAEAPSPRENAVVV